MAASLKGKRTPITTPPYQVPSVDITPDPPIFSLVTTFKTENLGEKLLSVCVLVLENETETNGKEVSVCRTRNH
jgi:hypothetical protein